jgi:hypothetical protein
VLPLLIWLLSGYDVILLWRRSPLMALHAVYVRYSFFCFSTYYLLIQLNKLILLVLVWLSGTDFTVPDLVAAAFAKADYRMLGTATVLAHANLPRPFHKSPSVQSFGLLHHITITAWFIWTYFYLISGLCKSLFVIEIHCYFSEFYSPWWLISVQY